MILSADMHTETNCNIQGNTFSIKASPVAFDILSSKLYSNPTLAVVRELLTNAYDSQLAAGNPDKDIIVMFPTPLDNEFSIRDFGTGLSKEDVMTLYTTFFGSTKSDTNDFTGGFGLGSKTPFAYTSSFTVTSFFNGTKYVFLATKKDGYPSILPIGEEPTDEPNGLYIRIPVNRDMPNRFYEEAVDYLSLIPEIKISSNKPITRNVAFSITDNISLYTPTRASKTYSWQKDSGVFFKQGQNTYRVTALIDTRKHRNIYEFYGEMDIVYDVPIGTLNITPSREQLAKDEHNNNKIDELLAVLNTKLGIIIKKLTTDTKFANGSDLPMPSCIARAYQTFLYDKYFSFFYNSIGRYYFNWSRTNVSFRFSSYDYKTYSRTDMERISLIYNYRPYIFVYTKDFKNRNLTRKINNILDNYDEFEETRVTVFSLKDSVRCHNNSVLNAIRNLKAAAWTLNNAEELNFDIQVMSSTEFLRKYPDHKTHKTITTKPKSTTSKPRCVNFGWINILNLNKSKMESRETKELDTCLHNTNNLIIAVNTTEDSVQSMFNRVFNFFRNVSLHLKDEDNNKFILNYLMNKLNVSIEDMRLPDMRVIITAKGNLKKFPNAVSFDLSEMYELLSNTKFKCMLPYNGTWYRYVRRFEEVLKYFNETELRFLETTYAYKRHLMVSKYLLSSNPAYGTKYNLINYDTYNYLIYNCSLNKEEYIRTDTETIVNSIINDKLSTMYRYIYNSTDSRNYTSWKAKPKLKNKYKVQLFKFLREGGNNVLF